MSDIILEVKHTSNGVVLPPDFLDGKGNDLVPWLPREILPSAEDQEAGKVYAIGYAYDPIIQKKVKARNPEQEIHLAPFAYVDQYELCRRDVPGRFNGLDAIKILHRFKFPMNLIIVLETGDIGFAPAGLLPIRKHNVVQGVYSKLGSRVENQWQGFVTNEDLAYVVNPDKGYLVNCNNFIGSDRLKYGYSQAMSFIHRKVRISQMLEDLINSGKKMTVQDMKDIQFDHLDVQMRESVADMLTAANAGISDMKMMKFKPKIILAETILKNWDFRYNKDKP